MLLRNVLLARRFSIAKLRIKTKALALIMNLATQNLKKGMITLAERRMFAKTIVDSDAFLEMPMSARLLYYDLAMRADDDGFINSPKKIMKFIGATNDDMNILILRKFIIPFDNGVVVIKHWRIHNYIRKDTYNETPYKEQKAMLELDENKAYKLSSRLTVDEPSTQVRLGKDSIGNIISPLPPYEGGVPVEEKSPKKISAEELIAEHNLSESLSQATHEWLSYKKERRFTYKEQGLKVLIKTISDKSKKYGEDRVIDLIAESISSGYQGILWQRLDKQQKKDKFNDFEQRKTSKQEMDELERKMLGL